jgi:hypothetical protein
VKGNIRISARVVHVAGRELNEVERGSKDVTYAQGELGGPDVHDARLESHTLRRGLQGREGKLCIGVRGGEELGELYIALQFEGPIDTGGGEPDLCMAGQNALLGDASDWIAEVLGRLDAEFEGVIEAQPCPKARTPLAVMEATRRLDPTVGIVDEAQVRNSVPAERRIETA